MVGISKFCPKTMMPFFILRDWETSINDVRHFSAIFDLPSYATLSYNVPFSGLLWTPLLTLKSDIIYGRSLGV